MDALKALDVWADRYARIIFLQSSAIIAAKDKLLEAKENLGDFDMARYPGLDLGKNKGGDPPFSFDAFLDGKDNGSEEAMFRPEYAIPRTFGASSFDRDGNEMARRSSPYGGKGAFVPRSQHDPLAITDEGVTSWATAQKADGSRDFGIEDPVLEVGPWGV